MEQAKELVTKIDEQVLELLGQHRTLKSKYIDLQENNVEFQESIKNQKNEIEVLKEQIVKLKIAKSLIDKEGSTEVKVKIEKLLREIDKCVGLLNQ